MVPWCCAVRHTYTIETPTHYRMVIAMLGARWPGVCHDNDAAAWEALSLMRKCFVAGFPKPFLDLWWEWWDERGVCCLMCKLQPYLCALSLGNLPLSDSASVPLGPQAWELE